LLTLINYCHSCWMKEKSPGQLLMEKRHARLK